MPGGVQGAEHGWHPGTLTPEGRTYFLHLKTGSLAWDAVPQHRPMPPTRVAWRWAIQQLQQQQSTGGGNCAGAGVPALEVALAAKEAEHAAALAKVEVDHALKLQHATKEFEARLRAAGVGDSRGGSAPPSHTTLQNGGIKPGAASAPPSLTKLQNGGIRPRGLPAAPPLDQLAARPRALSRPPPLEKLTAAPGGGGGGGGGGSGGGGGG
eukprot:COSAG05_NODE_4373_length_1545_cov_4.976487_1_plen_209_part_01